MKWLVFRIKPKALSGESPVVGYSKVSEIEPIKYMPLKYFNTEYEAVIYISEINSKTCIHKQ